MTPEEAGRLIARLRREGYLIPVRREFFPDGGEYELEDEFLIGPEAGEDRVTLICAMRDELEPD